MIHLATTRDQTLFIMRIKQLLLSHTPEGMIKDICPIWQGYNEQNGMKNFLEINTDDPDGLISIIKDIFPLENDINTLVKEGDQTVLLNLDRIRDI